MSNKLIFLCVITLCVHLIFWYNYTSNNDLGITKDYKIEIDSLNTINDSLLSEIKYHNLEIERYKQEISYLGNKKEKIIIKYKTKVDEIEKLSNNSLVNEFDSIFAKFNIK